MKALLAGSVIVCMLNGCASYSSPDNELQIMRPVNPVGPAPFPVYAGTQERLYRICRGIQRREVLLIETSTVGAIRLSNVPNQNCADVSAPKITVRYENSQNVDDASFENHIRAPIKIITPGRRDVLVYVGTQERAYRICRGQDPKEPLLIETGSVGTIRLPSNTACTDVASTRISLRYERTDVNWVSYEYLPEVEKPPTSIP